MKDLVWVGIRESEIKYCNFIDNFYNNEIIKQIEKNSNVKFMYYSQIYSYDSMKKLGLLDYVICLNNQDLIEFVNNKFKIKEYLKDYISILNHVLFKRKKVQVDLVQLY